MELWLEGISDMEQDNIVVFGGNTNMTCSSPIPLVLSDRTQPSRDLTPASRTLDSAVECLIPALLPAGQYRPVLHVAGRGWGYTSIEDTKFVVRPRIISAPTISSGSLRGGLSLAIPTHGLALSDVTRTRVEIGNTPCRVQSISSQGVLMCLTQPVLDDGYSSIVRTSSLLAYWSLQTDYHRSNGSYLSSDGLAFFRSGGALGARANASVHGEITLRQSGISGNNLTDQSVLFTEAAYLQVPALEEFLNPFGFAVEFWMKVPLANSSPHYRVVINSSSLCGDVTCGYFVMLNPCNQVEYWLGSGQHLTRENDETLTPLVQPTASGEGAESGVGLLLGDNSGSGQSSGEHESVNQVERCHLITDATQCSESCNGYIQVPEQENLPLPTGMWHVLRSARSITSDWTHVHASWHATAEYDSPASGDCLVNPCNGTQELAVDGLYSSMLVTYRAANSSIELGGSSSIPLGTMGVWNGVSPYVGYLDEVAYYSQPLRSSEIESRLMHGLQDTQPIWLSVESFDGVGRGQTPNVRYPVTSPTLDVVMVEWETVTEVELRYQDPILLRFEWTE